MHKNKLALIIIFFLASSNSIFGMRLHEAAFNGKLDIVKKYIEQGKSVDWLLTHYDWDYDAYGNATPLGLAACKSRIKVMEYLLEKGADINKGDAEERTALIYAVNQNQLEAVKFLVSKGADINKKSKYTFIEDLYRFQKISEGNAPLHLATQKGYTAIFDFLIAQKSTIIDNVDENGYTPLMDAILKQNPDFVKKLLKAGANPNKITKYLPKDMHGFSDGKEVINSPMDVAARKDNLEILKALIQHGGSLTEKVDEKAPIELLSKEIKEKLLDWYVKEYLTQKKAN